MNDNDWNGCVLKASNIKLLIVEKLDEIKAVDQSVLGAEKQIEKIGEEITKLLKSGQDFLFLAKGIVLLDEKEKQLRATAIQNVASELSKLSTVLYRWRSAYLEAQRGPLSEIANMFEYRNQ